MKKPLVKAVNCLLLSCVLGTSVSTGTAYMPYVLAEESDEAANIMNDAIGDPSGWYLSAGSKTAENGMLAFQPGGYSIYQNRAFSDETLKFNINASDQGWPAITFRSRNNISDPLSAGNSCYIIVLYPHSIELQRFNDGERRVLYGNVPGFDSKFGDSQNLFFNHGEDNEIELRAQDTAEGVHITLKINGFDVFDCVDDEENRLEGEGYFGTYQQSSAITLSSADGSASQGEKLITLENFETVQTGRYADQYAVGGNQSIEVTESDPLLGNKSLVMSNNSDTGAGGANGLYANVNRKFGTNDIVLRIRRGNTEGGTFRIVANSTNYAHDSYTLFSGETLNAYNADGTVNENVVYNAAWEGYDIPAGFDGYLFLKNTGATDISSISFGMAHNSFPANQDNRITVDSIAAYSGEDHAKIIELLKSDKPADPEEEIYRAPMRDVDMRDDFSDEKASDFNWTAEEGTFSLEDGWMKISNSGFSNIMADNKIWTDAQYEFELKVGDGGWAAFQFRKQQPEGNHTAKGYTMYFTDTGGYEILAGDGTATRSVGGGSNAAPDGNTSIKLKVVTKGKRIQVYVNNMESPAVDKEDEGYASGYAGFLKAGGTCYVKDFKVTSLADDASDIFADDFNAGILEEKLWDTQPASGLTPSVEEGAFVISGNGEKEGEDSLVSAKKIYRVYEGEPLELQYRMAGEKGDGFACLYQDSSHWFRIGQKDGNWYCQKPGEEPQMLDQIKSGERTVHLKYDGSDIIVMADGKEQAVISDVELTEEINLQFGASASVNAGNVNVRFEDVWAKGNGLFEDEIPTEEEFAEIMDGLKLENPKKDETSLTLPEVPQGYSVVIKSSSDEKLIAKDGSISLPDEEKSAEIVLAVTRRWDNETKESNVFHVTVPKPTMAEEVAEDVKDKIMTDAYIDQTSYRLPEVPEGFSIKIHSSSDPKIIALDGGMTPPETDRTVELTFEITNNNTGNTYITDVYKVDVPKKTDILELNFFKQLKYGIFVHYVWGGQTKMTLKPDGSYVNDPDELVMNAEKFADDCQDMGVQYVILTAWHAGTNPLYPSEVYKKYRTNPDDVPENDILMPVLDELNERNIEVFFYTHPADGHDFSQADKEALGYEMGPGVDYEKWNEYINAQYKELCERYKGKFRGMFIDEGLMDYNNEVFVDYARLRDTIKNVDSSLVMMQNHYSGKYTCDTAMIENAHMWDASITDLDTWATFQYPTGFTLTSENNWAAIKNPDYVFPESNVASVEDMFVYTVMQAASNTEGGGATWAAGPYAGGEKWENGMLETLKAIGSYIKPIEKSIKNTLPSTSYVTPAATRFPMLQWGVATKSVDSSKEYIHVLKAPESDTLELPAPQDGKQFTSARMLVSGKEVEMEQKEDGSLSLTLPDGESWDTYDTVIELSVDLNDYLKKYINQTEDLIADGMWQYTSAGVAQLKNALTAAKAAAADPDGDHGSAVTGLQDAVTVLKASRQYYAPTENLAKGAEVTASSDMENNVEWSVNNVVDGDRYCKLPYTNWNYTNRPMGWSSADDLNNPDHTEWIQLKLDKPSDVGAVYLYPRNDKDHIGCGFPVDFKIEVSEDGTTWTDVHSENGCLRPDGSVQKYLFSLQKNIQYIRVTGTKLRSDGDRGKDNSYRMQFAEIEVYGEMGGVSAMEPEKLIRAGVTTKAGEKPVLPETVLAVYPDGTEKELPVSWEEIDEDMYAEPGEFDVEGTVTGVQQKAYCTVKVVKNDGEDPEEEKPDGDNPDGNKPGETGTGGENGDNAGSSQSEKTPINDSNGQNSPQTGDTASAGMIPALFGSIIAAFGAVIFRRIRKK